MGTPIAELDKEQIVQSIKESEARLLRSQAQLKKTKRKLTVEARSRLENDVESARLSFENAQSDYDRILGLYEHEPKYATDAEMQSAEQSLDQAKLRYEESQRQLQMGLEGGDVDDIAIAEIDFQDDAEMRDEGWIAEGFTRATTDLPQTWWLQLITFDADGRPTVSRLNVPEDGRLEYTVQAIPEVRRPILIVAATAPQTLQPADYGLDIGQ